MSSASCLAGILKVGTTEHDDEGVITSEHAQQPWGRDVVATCQGPDRPPIPLPSKGSDGTEALFSPLVNRYLAVRNEFDLGPALWTIWTADRLPLGFDLPLCSRISWRSGSPPSAGADIKTGWSEVLRATRCWDRPSPRYVTHPLPGANVQLTDRSRALFPVRSSALSALDAKLADATSLTSAPTRGSLSSVPTRAHPRSGLLGPLAHSLRHRREVILGRGLLAPEGRKFITPSGEPCPLDSKVAD